MTDAILPADLRDVIELKPRRSLAAEAADSLRELIILGKLAPGLPVRERDLAEAFGISRTPLKEALRILEGEGLVVYSPTRRPFVANPSLGEINDWLRVQGALEALAGELACEKASDVELVEIERLNAAIREARDANGQLEAFRADMRFHVAIVAASGNAALAETHATYNARLWRLRFLSSQRVAGRDTTRQEHLDIVDALKTRDAAAARRALEQHLRTAETNIAAAMAEMGPEERAE
ncbi:MAG: GntR family transcriptional regulator [Pseudomonadota bacterium]